MFVFDLFQVEYLIEWGPSWEIEEKSDCPDLIIAFEQQRNKKSTKHSGNLYSFNK